MNTKNSFFKKNLDEQNFKRYNAKSVSLANYSPFSFSENLLFISGQLPIVNGKLKYSGQIDSNFDALKISESVLISTTNIIWVVNDFLEQLDKKVKNIRCLNLKGYFNSNSSFTDHSKYLDIASNLIVQILGKQNGTHSRVAIGVSSLPKNSPVEIDGIFSLIN